MKLLFSYQVGRLGASITIYDDKGNVHYAENLPTVSTGIMATKIAEMVSTYNVNVIYTDFAPMKATEQLINNLLVTKYNKKDYVRMECVE